MLAIFLSVSLFEVVSMARLHEPHNQVLSEAKDQEVGEHRHHRHHHHHHGNFNGTPTAPGHEMMTKLLPIIQSLMYRHFNKNGRNDSSDDTKLKAISKARALVMSKIHMKFTESQLNINGNDNNQGFFY